MSAKIIDVNDMKEIMQNLYFKDGWFYWNIDGNRKKRHDLAGSIDKDGYYLVCVNYKIYRCHRILYQLYHNIILDPNEKIDHIDRNKQNNSIENLRICTKSENAMNRIAQSNNKLGVKCIRINKNKTGNNIEYYEIRISKDGKLVYSDCFRTDRFTLQQVIDIRDRELLLRHGEFMNKG